MRLMLALAAVLTIPAVTAAQDISLHQVLLPGEGWKPVKVDLQSVGGMTADANGKVYISDPGSGNISHIDDQGKAEVFVKTSGRVGRIKAGAGGRLYGHQTLTRQKKGGDKEEAIRIVAIDVEGKESTIIEGKFGIDLAATNKKGRLYFSGFADAAGANVFMVNTTDSKPAKPVGLFPERRRAPAFFSRLAVSADDGTMAIHVNDEAWIWAVRIEVDGKLSHEQPYWSLRAMPGVLNRVHDLAFDSANRLFVASDHGIQAFDPTGRLSGVLVYPKLEPVEKLNLLNFPNEPKEYAGVEEPDMAYRTLAFGGPDFDRLYLSIGNKVFVRKLKAKGIPPPK